MNHPFIYKVLTQDQWRQLESDGRFEGAPIDIADGFIHFSTEEQLAETINKHFAGQTDLVIVEVETMPLGDSLKWEISRGGDHFPHLYATLSFDQVRSAWPHEMNED